MKISLLGGTGSFAEGLVIRWAKVGHEVLIGSRTQEKADVAAAEINSIAQTYRRKDLHSDSEYL